MAKIPLPFVDPPGLTRHRYRARIVPDADPNDDGRWVVLPHDLDIGATWAEHVDAVEPYVPDAHHVVAVDRFYRFDYDNSPIRVGNQAGYVP